MRLDTQPEKAGVPDIKGRPLFCTLVFYAITISQDLSFSNIIPRLFLAAGACEPLLFVICKWLDVFGPRGPLSVTFAALHSQKTPRIGWCVDSNDGGHKGDLTITRLLNLQ